MFKKWNQDARNALVVSIDLVAKMNDALRELRSDKQMDDFS